MSDLSLEAGPKPIIFTEPADGLHMCLPGGSALGLDIGSVRIGVAISDVGYRVAAPAGIIVKKSFNGRAAEIQRYLREYHCRIIVVGWPLSMNGKQGAKCQAVRQFVHNLRKFNITTPVVPWDERMTSQQVERMLITEADATRKQRLAVTDKLAASVILQGFLDYRRDALSK